MQAPALDDRGAPKVSSLYLTQCGTKRDALAWVAQSAKPLPASAPTGVVQVCCLKNLTADADWAPRSKNVKGVVKAWLQSLRVPQEAVVDVFYPRRSECGNIISVNVRLHKEHCGLVERTSGVAGFLARELPSDDVPAPRAFGNIRWVKRLEGESGCDLMKRARG